MNWRENAGGRHDVGTIPVIWLAILLSLLVHVTALWLAWPHLRRLALDSDKPGASSTLAVQLAERDTNAAASAAATPPPPAVSAPPTPVPRRVPPTPRRPRTPPRTPVAPPVITAPAPSAPQRVPDRPAEPALPTPPRPAEPERPQPPATRPMESDLASYIESRRRARGESPAATQGSQGESEVERRNRIIAANLGLDRKPTFNYDPNSAGGIFQIKRVGYDDAEFYFLGLDREINRNAKVLIEVRRGDASDIRIAIVRKMIAIIRDNVQDDFLWSSQRLGRQVHMSAKVEDNAALEDFILHDIFPETRR